MRFFNTFFKSKQAKPAERSKKHSDARLKIKEIVKLTDDSVKVVFDVPENLFELFKFKAGQYINILIPVNHQTVPRSYSICSGEGEPLAVGVKQVFKGSVSSYFNEEAKVGDELVVGVPMGDFTVKSTKGNFVAIAGGSGITPILSIAKLINASEEGTLTLFYGNRDENSIMFKEELEALSEGKVKTTYIFSDSKVEGYRYGMLTEEVINELFHDNMELLKADGFYICGPEQAIMNTINVLKRFGISEDKFHYELFTTPLLMKSKTENSEEKFEGISKVTVILDGEKETFDLSTKGDSILEEAEAHGLDAPYSCRGGICSTCVAKILEGSVRMDNNFTLSENEVAEGYILTCQSHPNSSEVIVSYDE